jgi:IstB-like ATP binding protein
MSASNATDGAPPPRVLLAHHLRQLKLPTFLREYEKVAAEAAREGLDHVRFLLRLVELELIDRERRMVERRIRAAQFPAVKSFDTFDFTAIPSLNKPLTLELARCQYLVARDTTSSRWATAEPERPTSLWRSASPPVSAAFQLRSIPRPGSCIS